MSGQQFSRGEIYYIDFGDGVGSEQKGYRPAVIISNNIGNRNSTTVIVAAITTLRPNKVKLPTHVYVGTETGLDNPSLILLEQIRTISKERVSDYVGTLSEGQIKALWRALVVRRVEMTTTSSCVSVNAAQTIFVRAHTGCSALAKIKRKTLAPTAIIERGMTMSLSQRSENGL